VPPDPSVSVRRLRGPSTEPAAVPLSVKEVEVVRLLAQGKTNREVGQALMISLSTVKTYVWRVMRKLNASDRTQAAVKAVELGLVHPKE
jgi:DNA-binding NarL/FixJ family response regulator